MEFEKVPERKNQSLVLLPSTSHFCLDVSMISSSDSSSGASPSGSTDSSSIQERIDNIVKTLVNSKIMEIELAALGLDLTKKPLTLYTRDDVYEASEKLVAIEFYMCDTTSVDYEFDWQRKKPLTQEEIKKERREKNFSEFYKLIPHKRSEGLSQQWIKDKRVLVKTLRNFVGISTMSPRPLEEIHSKFKLDLMPLHVSSNDYKSIKAYLDNGNALEQKCDLIDVFHVENGKNWKPSKTVESKLLWIGLPRAKLLETMMTGKIEFNDANSEYFQKFGPGLVFNDMVGGALLNAQAQSGTETALLLCQVKLGKRLVVSKADPMIEEKVSQGNFNYVFRYGSHAPEESGDVKHTDGFVIPLGKNQYRVVPGVKHYNVVNEFVVFLQTRIDIKYVVAVRLRGPPTPLLLAV